MILVYCDKLNPRIEYTFRLIITTILGNEVSFTTKSNYFLSSDLPKINYSYERFGGELYLKPHRLMHCKALIQPDIQPVWHEGEKYFFESSKDSEFKFDPIAASFYLVTRYEEYLDYQKDKHKRFPAEESILFKYGLLKKPVVNIWAQLLARKLKERYPGLVFPETRFTFLPTIDIDNAWAYAHKGLLRSAGAMAKSILKGDGTAFKNRINVLTGREKDAYDTYDFINQTFKGNEDKAVFFFLLGNYKKYDTNISWKNRHLQELIRKLNSIYKTGIHPSYGSGKKKSKHKLALEVSRLEKITGKEVVRSRQHFLRLSLPRDYRNLILNGIMEDYTMGFPSHPGFRAGICTPFPFYDLKNESPTNLMVVPFQVMDVSLKVYRNYSPEEALNEILDLMHEVKNAGGTFSYIWHNENLNNSNEWSGYREVFEKMNETGFRWANGEG